MNTPLNFVSVYALPFSQACHTLYQLLMERLPEQSISHRHMPTYAAHCDFIARKPYREFVFIEDDGDYVGSIYLTEQNEIGIAIFKAHQGCGYGKEAVKWMMERHHGERLLANINPKNERSIKMFEKLGFNLLQITLTYES